MTILTKNELNPQKAESHVEEEKLEEIPFPVLFKICIKPSFNMTELHKNGYTTRMFGTISMDRAAIMGL